MTTALLPDCPTCVRLPHKRRLAEGTAPEEVPGLEYVQGQFLQPGRYWDTSDMLERCPTCGTLYHHEHGVDTEDAFVGGPRTNETHQRILPERAKGLLASMGLSVEIEAQAAREPALLARFREMVEGDPEGIPDTLRPMVVEALTDRFLLDGDWATLEAVLLRNRDPRVALEALGDLVLLRFTMARRGPWPDYTDYRDVHPAAKEAAGPLLDANLGAFFACLDAWRTDGRPFVRGMVGAVDRSVAYYGLASDAPIDP